MNIWPREVGKLPTVTQLVMANARVVPTFNGYCSSVTDMVFLFLFLEASIRVHLEAFIFGRGL